MKKIMAVCFLIIPILAFAEEDFGVNVPEWKDFVPTAFVNIKEPKGLGKLNLTAKYWYERKLEFDSEIDKCRSMEANDERFNCYELLKVKQYKLNNDYNARLEAQINDRSSVPGMSSPTDNMIPLGGYFNQINRFMPNEIK